MQTLMAPIWMDVWRTAGLLEALSWRVSKVSESLLLFLLQPGLCNVPTAVNQDGCSDNNNNLDVLLQLLDSLAQPRPPLLLKLQGKVRYYF